MYVEFLGIGRLTWAYLMRKWNLALGFYQNITTANAVFKSLKRKGYTRATLIQHSKDGYHIRNKCYPTHAQQIAIGIVLFFLLSTLALLNLGWVINLIILTLAICGIAAILLFICGVDNDIINRLKSLVVLDEVLIIVQIKSPNVREVLKILRQVQMGHPVSFLLRSEIKEKEEEKVELPKEPSTMEQLSYQAMELAEQLKNTKTVDTSSQRLLKRLKKSEEMLNFLRHDVAEAEHIEQTLTISAEWLLDNTYVIQGAIEEILKNLPNKYYQQLPKVKSGPLEGLPRIYAIAVELVNHTSGKINPENITHFLCSYQEKHPLTIGELWAFPLILRLRLVEWVQLLAIEIDRRMREGEYASFWGNRLLQAARREPDLVPLILKELSRENPTPSPHFAEELLDHLFDEEAVLPLARTWLEGRFNKPIPDVLHEEQIQETAEQVAFSNAITSLITLSQLSWPVIFEFVSPVDVILEKDPAGTYSKMDFSTRNLYREALETLAKYSNVEETDIAKSVVKMAKEGSNWLEQHVGYYLIDNGRRKLESLIVYDPPVLERMRRWAKSHPAATYLGGIGVLTAIFEIGIIAITLNAGLTISSSLLFGLLSLLPVSEIAVQMMNFALTSLLPPTVLPKMSFKDEIPREFKTLVVVPILLQSPDQIQAEIDRLEIRYLANAEPVLYFGIFSDFVDAPKQNMESDQALLEVAIKGIQALTSKYGQGKFFLFHRQRVWCKGEKAWIGWERKRGKLDYLNRYLVGEPLPENIVYEGQSEQLKGVRYVITLDSDTQLPKNQAKQLIEVLSHPLNRPVVIPQRRKLERGYTIIQPRVCTDFPHTKASFFTRIFSEPSAIDPYTQAISNVYQDLSGEGTYHGKGIYDVEAFHRILSRCFPDEHLLSHDLIEGAFARVGFASDVCLFDLFPEHYLAWSKRKHRWMRGDWQIIDWLFPKVPTRDSHKQENPLSLMNRWKIFDNLRRALMPVSIVTLLICGWLFSPLYIFWTALALFVMFLPSISLFLCAVLHFSPRTFLYSWIDLKMEILRDVASISFLVYEALSSLDAMFRVFYRRMISHHHLLQWEVSNNGKKRSHRAHPRFILKLGWSSLFALITYAAVIHVNPAAVVPASLICGLWFLAPLIVYGIDKPIEKRIDQTLSMQDKIFLRMVARKTWRFFDEFVGPQTNWLPPDNYQAALRVEVAPRTSPTNIGLWLLTVLTAYDFKFISCDEVIDKTMATIKSLKKLELFEGHFLNWYDIHSLQPLYPRYISTVDSGNLLACMWTLNQGISQLIQSPILPLDALEGVKDTLNVLKQEKLSQGFRISLQEIETLISRQIHDLPSLISTIEEGLSKTQKLLGESEALNAQHKYWLEQIEKQLNSWSLLANRYLGWVSALNTLPREMEASAGNLKVSCLSVCPTFISLADGSFAASLNPILELAGSQSEEIQTWSKRLKESMAKSQWYAGEKISTVPELLLELKTMSDRVNLRFLYNEDRKVFSIGYNVDKRKLDNSYYDLLASEARIASLIAMAKGDVPLEHWWSLGRPYSIVDGRSVLLSWGGTMFEYLMPCLFNKPYPDSLLGEAYVNVVACQMDYGKRRGIPWGISESAYSAIDAFKIYQYRSFGVPGIGLKRGLEDDLVVSPYSTALALVIDAPSAVKNLRRMAQLSRKSLLSTYGYFESMDFTRQAEPSGERGVIVYAYFAHHQGMSIIAMNNLLNNFIMTYRFHEDPRINGVESLLYERIPMTAPSKSKGFKRDIPSARLLPFSPVPIMGVVDTPESVTPKINLLSNGTYSLMVTNAGGGYSQWRDIDITRWRADSTCDSWGSFCYIKDIQTGFCWSNAFHPIQNRGSQYSTSFKADKAEFTRKDYQIETVTEIVVSPEDNAEVRLITLANLSTKVRHLELTSYLELALAPHASDRAHPCFNKMFIETEALTESSSILAFRRLRSPEEMPIVATHTVAMSRPAIGEIQYETDRMKFIGRGNTLRRPAAIGGDLSGTTGTVLDPIFSLRRRVILEPGSRVQIAFVTTIADNKATALSLVEKYKDLSASHRAIELAWTYAQLELRHLRIHQEEAQLYQKLASRVLYPHVQLRSSADRLRNNRLGQSRLWAHGISGDLPIVVVTVGDIFDIDVVKQVLIAHNFWRLRGLKTDLVILNEEVTGYEHPLFEQIQRLIQAYAYRNEVNTPGGVFLRTADQIPSDEITLILSIARAVIVAARGSLRQQLVSPMPARTYPPSFTSFKRTVEVPSKPLPFLELANFNGIGGFTPDGRDYVIYLGEDVHSPIPWINVLANSKFGTLVSEVGVGCTWYGNSQTNRLTPWSNDPVLNPAGDAIYIRDEDSGTFWSPTPSPVREKDAYRIYHGQGFTRFEHNSHGIEQELRILVPVDDSGGLPLRIQSLKLFNNSSVRRRLTVTAYSDLVLGNNREETQLHLITEWDPESQALFAYNRYHPDFGSCLAFSSSFPPATSFTGDRTEFIGRNGSLMNPAALKRQSLSGQTGAALDACAALQVFVEIDPGAHTEVIFTLGYAQDSTEARKLLLNTRGVDLVEKLLVSAKEWWDRTLDTIQIETPEQSINYLLNRWLAYQNLSCRFWGRTGFYQSSGAYGFRDQLQDVMALLYSHPKLARDYILYAASRQFVEGDVQHWWHPQSGGGIRTRISDDLLWLPFVTAQYVRVTNDATILDENVTFLVAPLLTETQHEVYSIPEVSTETGSLLEHCRRAISKGMTAGVHGLPLIGGGDWNDGMNLVGVKGKGESVWLAWFLIHVMNDFADLLDVKGNGHELGEGFRIQSKRLAETVEANAWDGEWYIRAFFDDGSPLGSKICSESLIDSISQSWAVISGGGNEERVTQALASAVQYLVKPKSGILCLLTPPFNHTQENPGYIKGYPPGVRENGGQYTHGSLWLAMAYARKGDGGKAVELLKMMNPVSHARDKGEMDLYKVEPYVVAADVYDLPKQEGRGGWTWYTGSAGWMYRVWLEEVLGFKLRGSTLRIDCTIPKDWNSFKIRYRYKSSTYNISVENPHHLTRGKTHILLDDLTLETPDIPLDDDGRDHNVRVVISSP